MSVMQQETFGLTKKTKNGIIQKLKEKHEKMKKKRNIEHFLHEHILWHRNCKIIIEFEFRMVLFQK